MKIGILLLLAGLAVLILRHALPALLDGKPLARSRLWPLLTLVGLVVGGVGFALQLGALMPVERLLAERLGYADLGTDLADGSLAGRMPRRRDAASAVAVRTLPAAPATAALPFAAPFLSPQPRILAEVSADLPDLPPLAPAPEFAGLGPWHNSAPRQLSDLRGNVVLVEFWAASHVGSIRALPYAESAWQTYRYLPFTVIGIHTPEFLFEKDRAAVARTVRTQELTFPIAQDNDALTWLAFANFAWPSRYLIDAEGTIRYAHFGPGGHAETDLAIRALLREAGVRAPFPRPPLREAQTSYVPQTPRTWLAGVVGDAFQNRPEPLTEEVFGYRMPPELALHAFALDGRWQLQDGERQVLRSEQGLLRMRFVGNEVTLVLGAAPRSGAPPQVTVEVDGDETGRFVVQSRDLYDLWRGAQGEHEITLRIQGSGFEAYAFDFGP